MKTVLIVLVLVASGVIGKMFSSNYVLRDVFFRDLISLVNCLKNDISFKHSKLKDIFLEYRNNDEIKNKYVLLIIENFAQNECLKSEDLNELHFLSKAEKQNIISFFNKLGCFDDSIEGQNIINFLKILDGCKSDADEKRKKNESSVYKLSLAFGAMVCILII